MKFSFSSSFTRLTVLLIRQCIVSNHSRPCCKPKRNNCSLPGLAFLCTHQSVWLVETRAHPVGGYFGHHCHVALHEGMAGTTRQPIFLPLSTITTVLSLVRHL